MTTKRYLGAAIVTAITLVAAGVAPAPAADKVTMTALIASSAKVPYDELVAQFEKKHGNVKIETQYLGGGEISKAIDGGTAADIVLVGDTQLKKVAASIETPMDIYRTKDIVITQKKDKDKIKDIKDLANPGIKVSMGAPASAVGGIASQVVQKYAKDSGGFELVKKILDNVIKPQPEKGSDVVMAVEKGQADAAIVFITDGDPSKFNIVHIPDEFNVISLYQGTATKNSKNQALGKEFIALMASKEGQAVFSKHRYMSPK